MIERTFAKITGIQLDQQVSIDGSNQNCHFISFGVEFVGKTWPGADTGVPSSRLFFPQEVSPGQLMVSRALDANNLPPAIIAINKTAVQVGGVPAYSVAIGRWSNSPNPAIAVGDEVIFVGNTNPLPTGLQLIPGTTAEIASALVDYRDFTEGLACDIWSNTRFPDENIISGIVEGDNVFTGDNTFGGERVSVNNTYTVQLTNRYVDVDASSSNIPITAYDPVGNAGKKLIIEKTDSTTNNVTVDIDNDASPDITLTLASPITHLKSNGTIWEVIAEGDAITKFTGQSEFSNDVSFNGRSEFSNDVSFKEGVSFSGFINFNSTRSRESIPLPKNYHDIKIDYTNASDITILAGSRVRSSDDTTDIVFNSNQVCSLTTTGANGLDTGSEAASTHYYLYAIYNPTTETSALLFSTVNESDSGSVTLPSGFTKKRQLKFAVLNNASSDIESFIFKNNKIIYTEAELTLSSTHITHVLNNGSSTSFAIVDCSSVIPEIGTIATLATGVEVVGATATKYGRLRPVGTTGEGIEIGAAINSSGSYFISRNAGIEMSLDSNRSFEYKTTGSAVRIYITVTAYEVTI